MHGVRAKLVVVKTLAAIAAALLLWLSVVAAWNAYGPFSAVDRKQNMLLHHTDHAVILAACKVLMRGVQAKADDLDLWRGDPRIPPPIASLHPRDVLIRYRSVQVEFGGGFFHFGFFATLDKDGSPPEGRENSRMLLPGLYYYAEDGRIPD